MRKNLEALLKTVQRPSRYCGGELNSYPAKENAKNKFVLCFPDIYEIGLSNLGIKILYGILNERQDTSCELCFAPLPDMEAALKENNIELFSLQSRKSLREFDFIGFNLASELLYTTVLYMLDLAKIPLLAKDRGEEYPIIIAGGACCFNPMPMSEFFDLFVIGDGEECIERLIDLYNEIGKQNKKEFLKKASLIEGVFVPRISKEVKRTIVKDLNKAYYPTRQIISNTAAIHDRPALELFRGCRHSCKFCAASASAAPLRIRGPETLVKQATKLIETSGFEEIGLASLSTLDYPFLKQLIEKLNPILKEKGVRLSIPSSRVDSFIEDLNIDGRKGAITFAPEAGTERLRKLINKNITDEEIFCGLKRAFEKGYHGVKLYFMVGLPHETKEDILGIIHLVKKIKRLYKETATSKKGLVLSVSCATFIPKPFTAFEREKQISLDEITSIQNLLKAELKKIGVKFSFHCHGTSKLELLLSRGGKEMSDILLLAYKAGARLEGHSEYFNYALYEDALKERGLTLFSYEKKIAKNKKLPWHFIKL